MVILINDKTNEFYKQMTIPPKVLSSGSSHMWRVNGVLFLGVPKCNSFLCKHRQKSLKIYFSTIAGWQISTDKWMSIHGKRLCNFLDTEMKKHRRNIIWSKLIEVNWSLSAIEKRIIIRILIDFWREENQFNWWRNSLHPNVKNTHTNVKGSFLRRNNGSASANGSSHHFGPETRERLWKQHDN